MTYTDYVVYDEQTGKVVRFGTCLDAQLDGQARPGERLLQAQGSFEQYVENETLVPIPPRPSDSHDWDWTTKTWAPNIPATVLAKKQAITDTLNRCIVSPILYDGAPFDADPAAIKRIICTLNRLLRGDGLPDGWIGWRDFKNNYHWGTDTPEQVKTHLAALSRAIENREQAALIVAWTHKANLAALTDFDELLAYDVATGWPS